MSPGALFAESSNFFGFWRGVLALVDLFFKITVTSSSPGGLLDFRNPVSSTANDARNWTRSLRAGPVYDRSSPLGLTLNSIPLQLEGLLKPIEDGLVLVSKLLSAHLGSDDDLAPQLFECEFNLTTVESSRNGIAA